MNHFSVFKFFDNQGIISKDEFCTDEQTNSYTSAKSHVNEHVLAVVTIFFRSSSNRRKKRIVLIAFPLLSSKKRKWQLF